MPELPDEIAQALRRAGEAFEEERVERAVAAGKLRGMQVPSLIEPVDQRMAQVVRVEPPRRMHRALVVAHLLRRKLLALRRLVRGDRHGGGGAVGEEDAGPRVRHLHHVLGEVAGRMPHALVRRDDVARGRVVVGAEVRREAAAARRGEQLRQHRLAVLVEDRLGGLDHRLHPQRAAWDAQLRLQRLEGVDEHRDLRRADNLG